MLKDLKRRGVQRMQIFITDDLPGLEEAIKKILPEPDWQLCVLCTKRDREALAEALKRIYRAETQEEAKGACGAYGNAGKPRLMRFPLSCVTQGPFVAASTPPTGLSGSPRREKGEPKLWKYFVGRVTWKSSYTWF